MKPAALAECDEDHERVACIRVSSLAVHHNSSDDCVPEMPADCLLTCHNETYNSAISCPVISGANCQNVIQSSITSPSSIHLELAKDDFQVLKASVDISSIPNESSLVSPLRSSRSNLLLECEQCGSSLCDENLTEETKKDDNDVDSDLDTTCSEELSQSSELSDSVSTVSLLDSVSSTTTSSAYFSESVVSPGNHCVENNCKPNDFSVEVKPKSLFRKSLFPNVVPTIDFRMPGESVSDVHEDVKRIMKWQLTKTTPVVMKKILLSTGFKFTKKLNTWIGTWGKHMKAFEFQQLKLYQKVNHFPGTFQIGRKDRLWRNISHLQSIHGKKEFGFVPLTFVFPSDSRKLYLFWDHEGNKQRWIVKPPAAARGKGIRVIHKFGQLPKQGSYVVQKYLTKPYLINGAKFDLRLYVYVPCFNPLRIYLYGDGLVRFASALYSNSVRSLRDRYVHLTNSSVNKTNLVYTVGDETSFQGHKWTLKTLWSYMKEHGIDTASVWEKIVDLVVKTVLSCESCVTLLSGANVPNRYNCHELFGFDVMLDESLRPWLLEVNISPSLHSSSSLDAFVKGNMLRDLLNIAGIRLPPHLSKRAQMEISATLGIERSAVCLNLGLYNKELSAEEKSKQEFFAVLQREKYIDTILENLTPNDVCHLVEYEDEITRAGQFQIIFPKPTTHRYHKFLPCPRYHINLLDAWEHKYHDDREKGLQRLRDACLQNVHQKCVVNNARQTVIEMPIIRRNVFICQINRTFRNSVRYRWHLRNHVSTLNAYYKLHRKRLCNKRSEMDSDASCSTDDASSV